MRDASLYRTVSCVPVVSTVERFSCSVFPSVFVYIVMEGYQSQFPFRTSTAMGMSPTSCLLLCLCSFGRVSIPISISHIHCNGNESHLLECQFRNDSASKSVCTDNDLVGLQCCEPQTTHKQHINISIHTYVRNCT